MCRGEKALKVTFKPSKPKFNIHLCTIYSKCNSEFPVGQWNKKKKNIMKKKNINKVAYFGILLYSGITYFLHFESLADL